MADGSPSPKKVHPDNPDLESLSKADLIVRLKEQEQYIKQLESKKPKLDKGDDDVDWTERLKQHQRDAARRENTLVHRLTTKEQELQDMLTQIAEIKQAEGTTQLKSMLLDPAVNIVFQKMTKEMDDAQEKLKQTQNELSAWKFTPDSQTGKRLMARCQMLLQENEELGKTIASGRTAKLEGEIALQKTLVTEMKNNQSELDEFLGDLEEDVEGMQTMIYVLQTQLRDTRDTITTLEEENTALRAGHTPPPPPRQTPPHTRISRGGVKTERYEIEDNNRNAGDGGNYVEMEMKYYENDRTDSDLEAEYNYEGLYENDDRYQEELERQQAEYDLHEYSHGQKRTQHEPMETDSMQTTNSAERMSNLDGKNLTHGDLKSYVEVVKSADQDRTTCYREEISDSGFGGIEASNRTSPDTTHRQSKQLREGNSENSQRIPSPKSTKHSPVPTSDSSKARTTVDENQLTELVRKVTSNGSPSGKSSPQRVCSSSNQLTSGEDKDPATPDPFPENSHTTYDLATSPNNLESENQKFVNGVTSTVDDIEDI
ncbi:pre-mRNA-splicing regulator WTAP-like [Mya arenaria]|uniref:pre-mRNA-splicing regulator WTAP-like n=1 Tax=Mya arenaria TaxID=6604 RepID=UPI0022E0DC1C|nr:pre-mRNA-splicing regulator WTAP-like [Mya arenaria]